MSRMLAFVVLSGLPVFVLWFGGQLPSRVASHFDVTGSADAYMPRSVFVLVFSLVAAGAPQFVRWWLVREARATRLSRGNEAAARSEFVSAIAVRADALAIALSVFLGYIFALVVQAHLLASEVPRLDMLAFFSGLLLFLLFCTIWYIDYGRLNKAFGRPI